MFFQVKKSKEFKTIARIGFFLILFHLTACHPKINTINFVFQEISSEQLLKYSSLRDLPLPENRFKGLPLYLLIKSLAAKVNVSNVVTKTWHKPDVLKKLFSRIKQDEETNEITIFTHISSFSYRLNSPVKQWERFKNSNQKPIFFIATNVEWNFAYCDLPQWKTEPVWSLRALVVVLDNKIWICTAAAILAISATLGPKLFDTNFFLLLSSIFCSGLSGILKRRKLIFVLWLFLIRILTDIYGGGVSSRLIKPPTEQFIRRFEDLDRNNYSAAGTGDNVTVYRLRFFSAMATNKTGTWINKGIIHLTNLLARSVIASASIHNQFAIGQFLVRNYSAKVFFAAQWQYPMYIANLIEDARSNGIKSFENDALCHLGEETITGGVYYWTFMPPNNERVARYFLQLVESGIFARFVKEHEQVSHSVRVQERNRFVSKSYVKTGRYAEKMTQGLKHQFEGKLWKVFFLWAICIVACFIGMGLELAYGFKIWTRLINLTKASHCFQVMLLWYWRIIGRLKKLIKCTKASLKIRKQMRKKVVNWIQTSNWTQNIFKW